ncbi:GATA transcription factor 4 [Morus notabilis]|uniref:GATA transcription factor 4 n=1 Tax=Morus notabilis TaxID=981085 RepID=UPI000CED1E9C|nr:GATA transcription factor 4 [Morus notabilis]
MDMYGLSAQDCFRIDDLLDFSNDDLFSSISHSSDAADLHHHNHLPPLPPTASSSSTAPTDFTNDLCVPPSDDAADLEWLSRFVDDSFSDIPTGENYIAGSTAIFPNDASFSVRARSKRSRAPAAGAASWTAPTETMSPIAVGKSKPKGDSSPSTEGGVRRCSHCASEKTPQWRTGPMGPKTLCNACGVRYKSGRLVPEYRPAASPTFVLTQHSNSHRKVLELRRQKEIQQQEQQQQEERQQPRENQPQQQQEQFYPHHHGFRVC